jgi:hypothetical protein
MGCQDYGQTSLVYSILLTEEGMNDEFVEESLQKGTIRSLPLRWFMYVLSLNMRVKFGTTVVRAIQTN